MRENITVSKALNRSKILLVAAPLIAMMVVFGLSIFAIGKKLVPGPIAVPLMLIIGIGSGWLVWSFNVVKWKIWAYENVRNVHELTRKAINQNLIWPDGSWCNKTEIWSYDQKQKFRQLEKKFDIEDEYHDDLSIPKETSLYYSKVEIYLSLAIGAFFVFAFFYFGDRHNYIWIIMPLFGIYFIYRGFKKFINSNKPQLIINDSGIYIDKNKENYVWDRITGLMVYSDKTGSFLSFLYIDQEPLPGDSFHKDEEDVGDTYVLNAIQTEINEFNLSVAKIEKLLQIYRVRFEKNKLV
jgi:hypothetical protein